MERYMDCRDDELIITLRIWSEKKRLSPAVRILMREAAEALQKYVPVVRCKDCKYSHAIAVTDINTFTILSCNYHNAHGEYVCDHGFCYWGERRKDAAD